MLLKVLLWEILALLKMAASWKALLLLEVLVRREQQSRGRGRCCGCVGTKKDAGAISSAIAKDGAVAMAHTGT